MLKEDKCAPVTYELPVPAVGYKHIRVSITYDQYEEEGKIILRVQPTVIFYLNTGK
jgi:hypothetical protein